MKLEAPATAPVAVASVRVGGPLEGTAESCAVIGVFVATPVASAAGVVEVTVTAGGGGGGGADAVVNDHVPPESGVPATATTAV